MPLVNGWDTIKDSFKLWFGKSRTLIVKAELKKITFYLFKNMFCCVNSLLTLLQ